MIATEGLQKPTFLQKRVHVILIELISDGHLHTRQQCIPEYLKESLLRERGKEKWRLSEGQGRGSHFGCSTVAYCRARWEIDKIFKTVGG